jgi:hypothetical protein
MSFRLFSLVGNIWALKHLMKKIFNKINDILTVQGWFFEHFQIYIIIIFFITLGLTAGLYLTFKGVSKTSAVGYVYGCNYMSGTANGYDCSTYQNCSCFRDGTACNPGDCTSGGTTTSGSEITCQCNNGVWMVGIGSTCDGLCACSDNYCSSCSDNSTPLTPTPVPTAAPTPIDDDCNVGCGDIEEGANQCTNFIYNGNLQVIDCIPVASPSPGDTGVCLNYYCQDAPDCICPTATPTPSPAPTATPTPLVAGCNDSCNTDGGPDCTNGLDCIMSLDDTAGICRTGSCEAESDCICATGGPTVAPEDTTTPTESPTDTPTDTPTESPVDTSSPTPTEVPNNTSQPGPQGPPSCYSTSPTDAPNLWKVTVSGTTAMVYFTSVAPVTEYQIFYGYTEGDTRFATTATSSPATINDLNPNTTYYFSVKGVNVCAGGPLSAWVPGNTGTGGGTGSGGTGSATSAPALPNTGTDWPSSFGVGIGVLTIIGSLLLAL